MKSKIIFCTLCILFAATTFAQTDSTTKKVRDYKQHEINIGFVNLLNLNNNNNDFYQFINLLNLYDNSNLYGSSSFFNFSDFMHPLQYGIGYKFHFKKGAIRAYFDIGKKNSSTENSQTSTPSSSYSYAEKNNKYSYKWSSYQGRLGYEYIIGMKKIQFYCGADLILQSSFYQYNIETTITYINTSMLPEWQKNNNDLKSLAYGVGGILGFTFRFNEIISLNVETRIDYFKNKENGTNESSSWQNYSSSEIRTSKNTFSTTGENMQISPLGLVSLNVHF